jgi:Notch-like protein
MIRRMFLISDIDECASNPCQNGATCTDYTTMYMCECAGGWEGTECDIGRL